jgi:hypothetical protein
LTPNAAQPAWISQNSSGAFSEYGAPLMCGTQNWWFAHMSHATASARVECSGIGGCMKIVISATSRYSGSHHSKARRRSVRA